MSKKGVLLINLGTPDHADTKSVKRYLREFLMDARVIDLPKLVRWVLVNFLVIPFRSKQSTHAYQKIWLHSGSPLLVHGIELQQTLANELGPGYKVELGMRYGNPSIASAIEKLNDCSALTVIPLFPQYSSAASGSAIEMTLNILASQWNIPNIHVIKEFYNDAGFIAAYADVIRKHITDKSLDTVIFSYHGLPERHITRSTCATECNHLSPCPMISSNNADCYRAQCYETTRLLVQQLKLPSTLYHVAFQSRLGRTPWIKPYLDALLINLAKDGKKNIAIVCPSFIADCLETLEEINIKAREQWRQLGGHELTFIPCLNDQSAWVKSLAKMVINEHIQTDTYKELIEILNK